MLHNKSQMIAAIKTLALALSDLNEQVMYVGGAVAGLYADNPGAPESRPTKDVDIVLEVVSLLKLETLRQDLAKRSIHFASDENVICRFTYQNILLDVMSTQAVGWAPSNPWFKPGFKHSQIYCIDNAEIRIMSFPYFLASKFTAFLDRGIDARTSQDFEDIAYVLDNRNTMVNDILSAPHDVKNFLIAQLNHVLNDSSMQEAVMAHLEPATQIRRYEMLTQKVKEIIS